MNRHGFSLIEVNLAILLATVGLLTLFALFPLGLRESEMAIIDTQEAMFADNVLSAMRANAQDILDWGVWTDRTDFVEAIGVGVYPIGADVNYNPAPPKWSSTNTTVQFPPLPGASPDDVTRELRYDVRVDPDHWDRSRKRIVLRVKSGRYGQFDFPQVYSTEVIFMGM